MLFALKILLPEVSNRTFLPVVVATGAATLIGRILIGPDPAFSVPEILFPLAHTFSFQEGLAFVILGARCGVASWAFIRLLVVMEDNFPRLPGNAYSQNIVGIAVIGLMMIGLTRVFGHSYIDGVGYGVILIGARRQDDRSRIARAAVRLEASCHDDQPRLWAGLPNMWIENGMFVVVECLDAKREKRSFIEVGMPAND